MKHFAASDRERVFTRMADAPLDVLVIGGGITGVGVAQDAAMRGLRVALVERDDFGSGTSSRSSKMIHGGLRYLASGDVGLVRESLRERRSLQVRAAHMVAPLPMILPIDNWRDRAKYGSGLWAYDALGAWRAGRRHRWLSRAELARQAPNVSFDGLRGGLAYQDAAADDARLVITVLRTAVASGALALNGARVDELLELDGRVVGARVVSDLGEADLRARVVVNATGVWADQVGSVSQPFRVMPSKGIHLTVARSVAGIRSAVAFFPQTSRNIFIEPWDDDLAIVGTSDEPWDGDMCEPPALAAEVVTLLEDINRHLVMPIQVDDVVSAWAGVRPLVVDRGFERPATGSRDVSRNHRTVIHPGMVTMVGGKLTTYRQMAEDAVDAALLQMGESARCVTAERPLIGCPPANMPLDDAALAVKMDIDLATAAHLHRRYGTEVQHIAELWDEDSSLREQLHPDRPYVAAEAAFAARYEMVRSVDDVLGRRTRIAMETSDGGAYAAPAIDRICTSYG